MTTKNNLLAIIPARSGSQSVKKKNIKELHGKPLLAYTSEIALKIKAINDLILSTDCPKIAKIGKKLGLSVPFLRPKNLSTNNSHINQTIKYCLQRMEKLKKCKYDEILLLQPTSPFREIHDINKCIKILRKNKKIDSVVSVTNVDGFHPLRMKIIRNKLLLNLMGHKSEDMRPRQKLYKVYIRNGAIYLFRRSVFDKNKKKKKLHVRPYIMSKEKSVNIDSIFDFYLAEKIIENKKI